LKRSVSCLCFLSLLVFARCAPAADPDLNLVAYWNFDDAAATDLSGNSNHGTIMGQATLAGDPEFSLGRIGYSLDLDRQNQDASWMEVADSNSLNITGELTILAWIRPGSIEDGDGLVSKGDQQAPWALRLNANRSLRFTANTGFNLADANDPNYAPGAVGSGDHHGSLVVPEVNEAAGIDWSFVGVVSDTNSLRFIVNTKQEVLPVSHIFAESNEPLILGAFMSGEYYFNGLMDEVRIYNRALSHQEVLEIRGRTRLDRRQPYSPKPTPESLLQPDEYITLAWTPGDGAISHNIYVGFKEDSMELLVPAHDVNSLDLGWFYPGDYSWQIGEIQPDGAEVRGNVWRFAVTDYLVVDDFEDYDNFHPNRIFDTWVDGWGDPNNGATVGHKPTEAELEAGATFVETGIVHSGCQSMPFYYDNNIEYSAVTLTLVGMERNWTRLGVKSLSLWHHGIQTNDPERMFVEIEDAGGNRATVYNTDPNSTLVTNWNQWGRYGQGIALSEFTDVDLADVESLTIGFDTRGNSLPGGSGLVYFDDIRLYPPQCIPSLAKPIADITGDCFVDMSDLEILIREWLLHTSTPSEVGYASEAERLEFTAPMKVFSDPGASNGLCLGTDYGIGDANDSPPADGVARYMFDAQAGIHKVMFRVLNNPGDSFWVRIRGAADHSPGTDPNNPGWVNTNGMGSGTGWSWDDVHSDDHDRQVVYFALPGGTHILEIARRESGALLDSLLITRDLDLDQRFLLPDLLAADLNQDQDVDFVDYAIMIDTWLDEILWP